MNSVFSYGEIGIDNIIQVPNLPSPEQAAFPTSDTYHIGGAAANYAVLLASWKVEVGLSGNVIGQDELGHNLITWMRAYPDLDLGHLEIAAGASTPFCRILVTPNGERSILVYGYPLTPKTNLTAEMLAGVRFLALDLYGGEERLLAARLARKAGVQTIVNDLICDHPILKYSDIIVNSAAYIRCAMPGADVRKQTLDLHEQSGAAVITTDGGDSIFAVDQNGNQYSVDVPGVQAVDATGAGDAFRAGLTYGLLQGWDWKPAIQLAAATGALKVSRIGAVTQPPSLAEALKLANRVYPDFDRN